MNIRNIRDRLRTLGRGLPRGWTRQRARIRFPNADGSPGPEWAWLPPRDPSAPVLEIPSYDERFENPDGSPRDDVPEVTYPESSTGPYY